MNRWRAFWADESGQSLAEYAVVTSVFLIGCWAVGGFMLPRFVYAWDVYQDSVDFVLSLPIP
ncbi:MAG: hypothetical protein CMH55_06785 [Myxococcales bacterium]|nr:hypothetical protein [Myxococcales bacterium]